MTQAATVTAEDLVRALKRRKAALPAEIGSFVVLEACDALLHANPARVTAAQVLISEDGHIQLASAQGCPEPEATHMLHQLLAFMLVAAGPAPLPALMRLLEKGPSSGRWTLASLRDDLEASLVPLNRHASRRVLSRFVREIGWAERAPAKKPTFQDLDSELSSFLSEEPRARPPLIIEPEPEPEPELDDTHEDLVEAVEAVREQVRFFESARPAPQVSGGKTLVDVVPSGATTSPRSEEAGLREPAHEASERVERAPSLRPMPRVSRPPSEIPSAPRSPALIWGGILLALSIAIVIATAQLRPELLGRLLHGDPEPVVKQPLVVVKRPAAGDLVIRVATERAQILRFVGRGPVTVPHLPLGIAHEFVGVSDTASPARLLVPKDAEWEGTPDGPRYEAAMQLRSAGTPGSAELGETLLPQDVGTPNEKLGSVRIVTTPRGAKVYQVIGFAPEARVEALPLESTQELLIYRKGYASELRVIAPSDYVDRDGKKVAELELTLTPLANNKAAATKR